MQQLMNEGLMYFQTIEHYRKLEADELRGDPSEGLSEYYQAPLVEITWKGDNGKSGRFSGKAGTLVNAVRLSTNHVTRLHAFCLYAVSTEDPLRKFREFEYQREYRFAVATGRRGPWKLRLGSLHGIAEIGDTVKANQALTLGYNLLTA